MSISNLLYIKNKSVGLFQVLPFVEDPDDRRVNGSALHIAADACRTSLRDQHKLADACADFVYGDDAAADPHAREPVR